ncbi:hypothetical protein [Streptomyces cylindrosporus]|uniref:Uncharacterized protein n=1 Tax=Streptomyces cylindrosporus TaxID=2927583 RepID=A0ABS9YF63_9ACTN|nr:hypothetical protein [Streptomyces cylindrosporus]MCI3275276.1 hypothetical protein [Streptomyces cylindrosporus]
MLELARQPQSAQVVHGRPALLAGAERPRTVGFSDDYRLLGAIYLVFLGTRSLWQHRPTAPAPKDAGVLYTGLLPTLAWLGGHALLLSRARQALDKPRTRRALGRTTGLVLIGFGLAVAAGSRTG